MPDQNMTDIRAKSVDDLTEDDAIAVDGHLAADLLGNYVQLKAEAQAMAEEVAETATTVLTRIADEGRSPTREESETLSFSMTKLFQVEMAVAERIDSLLKWSQRHAKDLVGSQEKFDRLADLLEQRERRTLAEREAFTEAEVTALESIRGTSD